MAEEKLKKKKGFIWIILLLILVGVVIYFFVRPVDMLVNNSQNYSDRVFIFFGVVDSSLEIQDDLTFVIVEGNQKQLIYVDNKGGEYDEHQRIVKMGKLLNYDAFQEELKEKSGLFGSAIMVKVLTFLNESTDINEIVIMTSELFYDNELFKEIE